MKEFMMIFRYPKDETKLQYNESDYLSWQDWIGSLIRNQQFVATHKLAQNSEIVNTNNKEVTTLSTNMNVGGYLIAKANSILEAKTLAKECPILAIGGNVEIKEIEPM